MMAYVHLGSDVTVHSDDIIGIFDIERVTVKKSVNEFLRVSQKSGRIYYVSLDLPKSFVVTDESVYVSNVSADTLKKRSKENYYGKH
jgi:aminopeptidase C